MQEQSLPYGRWMVVNIIGLSLHSLGKCQAEIYFNWEMVI